MQPLRTLTGVAFGLTLTVVGCSGGPGTTGETSTTSSSSSSSSSGGSVTPAPGASGGSSGTSGGGSSGTSQPAGVRFRANGEERIFEQQIFAAVADGKTLVSAYANASPEAKGPYLNLVIEATSAGAYPCGAGTTGIAYRVVDGEPAYTSGQSQGNAVIGKCLINLQKVGAVGEPIEGTFTATLVEGFNLDEPKTIEITRGTFSVVNGAK